MNAPEAFGKSVIFTVNQMNANRENTEKNLFERLAGESGLAVVIADGDSAPVDGANNNSMCRALYSSKEFAPRCEEFCGRAFEWATGAGKTVSYKCHAGLNCLAVPLKTEEKPLVAIVGRTFLKGSDYREATEKAVSGEWRVFPPTRFFENVLLTGSPQNLEKLAKRLERLSDEEKRGLFEAEKSVADKEKTDSPEFSRQAEEIAETQANEIAELARQFRQTTIETEEDYEKIARRNREEAAELAAWRSLFGSLLKLDYRQACVSILNFLQKRYGLTSLIWLENKENRLETVMAFGEMNRRQIQIGVSADDERLLEAASSEMSLELRERKNPNSGDKLQIINLFPAVVGGEVRSALAVGDRLKGEREKRRLAHFCRTVAAELEILRLREELSRRSLLTRAVRKLNENLKKIDAEDFWLNLTQISAELLRAERASLLIYNEKTNVLEAKALIGAFGDLGDETIGVRVAQMVLNNGAPLVISDIEETGFAPAPPERKYKTGSFLSYPITIGEKKIAVLNFTDRADVEVFGDYDLELLHEIAPQIAVAIDRASLRDKAGEFEQLSVTDALTGLWNIRYLKKRMTEEINRSKRHRSKLSFMMIDVDFFKSYNDSFGHAEGDEALKTVGMILSENLRSIDVAARYGGEEFSILLPQTTIEEAVTIAERIRARVEAVDFPKRKITISIGIASYSKEVESPENLISFADKALYEAKRKGRNNVQTYGILGDLMGE